MGIDRPPPFPGSPNQGTQSQNAGGTATPAGAPSRRQPWGIGEALLVVIAFALSQPLSSLLGSIVLPPILSELHTPYPTDDDLFKVLLPGVIVFSHIVGWSGLIFVVCLRYRLPLFNGLRFGSLHHYRLGRIFGAGMLLQVLGVILALLLPPPEDLDNPMLRFLGYGGWTVLVLFLMAVILAPFLEEALFRGLLLPALRRRLRFIPAAFIATAIFTGLHSVQTSGYWPALLVIFVCGWVLAYLREASGHLWPSIVFHMGFNFTALLPILLLGGDIPEGYSAWLSR